MALRGEGPNKAVVRPTRASLWRVREDDLHRALGISYSTIAIIKDLILEAMGFRLRYSRMADGMVGCLEVDVIASLYTNQHLTEELQMFSASRKMFKIYRDSSRVIISRDAAYSVMLVYSKVRQ